MSIYSKWFDKYKNTYYNIIKFLQVEKMNYNRLKGIIGL